MLPEKEKEMAEKKITQKDLYNRIAAVMADDPEVVEFCQRKIASLEKAAARPRVKKVDPEVEEFRTKVLDALSGKGEPVTNKEMAGEFGVSAQKMAATLRYFVGTGQVVRTEGEKKSDPALYALA